MTMPNQPSIHERVPSSNLETMTTYAETFVQCPHCHLLMIYTKPPENGIQFTACEFQDCVGFNRQYKVKMIEVEIIDASTQTL